jgi:hypothetical protein
MIRDDGQWLLAVALIAMLGSCSKTTEVVDPPVSIPAIVPTIVNASAIQITSTSCVFTAEVRSNGLPTVCHFEYGTSTSYGQRTKDLGIMSAAGSAIVKDTVTNLLPGTAYHFRLVASGSGGTTMGSDSVLTTLQYTPGPPKLTFPLNVGTQWTYRHSYLAGVGATVTESRSGSRIWEIVSTLDTSSCILQVVNVDTIYMRIVETGRDTSFVTSLILQFAVVVHSDTIVSDWKKANAMSTIGGVSSEIPRTVTDISGTVEVADGPFSVSRYVSGTGLVRYSYSHGTPGGHTQEELALVDKSIK